MLSEPQFIGDLLAEPSAVVPHAGHVIAGMKLAFGAQSTGNLSRFEHCYLAAALAEFQSGDQTVVARTDDNGVEAHFTPNMVLAHMAPGDPMTPPPGWVPDPHIHKSRTGVR